MKNDSMMAIRLLTAYCLLLTASCGLAANDAEKMGFNHLGAEFGAYEVDAQGGLTLGGLKKGGNRLGYPIGGGVETGDRQAEGRCQGAVV